MSMDCLIWRMNKYCTHEFSRPISTEAFHIEAGGDSGVHTCLVYFSDILLVSPAILLV